MNLPDVMRPRVKFPPPAPAFQHDDQEDPAAAEELCATLPSNPERTVALRKLLEAKDCAVRALIYK